ncbi:probable disease resistance protein At1g12280 isoform X2 [Durio zibethinus]|uniref:Probable disease resistance protein At1g12280 isoform X2 n=1 Tax=Durio zibethinus TaxID=66656 RepID=A0A6P5X7X0_DURZI|nr:probable disease resistance protein At1g12280 isoform X2 [Durio zibethinus]
MGNIFSISASCDTVITRCCDCVAGQAQFVCKLEENVEALKIALAELTDLRNDVIRRVKIAEDQQQLKRLDQVQGWLSRAETLINGAHLLIEQSPQEIKKLCVGGCFSMSPKSNLKFGKQITKMLRDVVDHKSKGVFDKVAEEEPTPLVTERPTEHTVGLESTFDKAWSILEAEQVGIVGLYGMGGVGKTTLLNKINNKFCEPPNRFHVVIWIVVSKGFYIGKIQDDIAKRVGIADGTWQDKTPEEKALNIFRVLKEKKFVLLLDDIWERVDLSKVGIPLPTQKNGSKLVFTTRSIKVCGQMEAQKKIEVRCLPEEKAWELFQEKVGEETLDSNPCIRELAHELAKECGGLPLALVTIARAMACKNKVEEWKDAIEVCRRSSASVFPEMGEEVYPLLKFSFDSLPNDMFRTCLLYCSLFSEDYPIDKEKLIDFWIGEGFLDGHGNTSLARNQGHQMIGSLLHACLLEEINEFRIKMHDVIRDMSLWIACECEEEKWRFFVQAGYQLTKLPEVQNWGSIRRMSLMKNRIENLVEAPNCRDLQTLFLNGNQLKVINNDFFQFMCGLKVLNLSGNRGIEELPVGISKLVSLECLDLSYTGIRQLPIELKALEKLKCLNLEYSESTIRIPRQLISTFSKLQVLRMFRCYSLGQEVEDNSECLVEELKCLNHLNVLTVNTTSALGLDSLLRTERLCSCTLAIQLLLVKDSKRLNILSLANMKSLEFLDLGKSESLEEVEMEWGGLGRMIKAQSHIETSVIASKHCFQSLREVFIYECSKLKDITWLILAPNLRQFNVVDCNNMEEIINKRKLSQVAELVETLTLFGKLESLFLQYLPELKSIYWDTLPFSCLKEIYVHRCPKLKRLPLDSNSAKENKISIRGEKKWWKELQWEDECALNDFLLFTEVAE